MIVDERMTTFINSLDAGNTPFLNQIEEEAIKEANIDIAVFNPAIGYLVSSKINAEVGTDLKDILDRARTQYICGQIDEKGLQEQFKVWEQRGGADLIAEVNELYQADTSK